MGNLIRLDSARANAGGHAEGDAHRDAREVIRASSELLNRSGGHWPSDPSSAAEDPEFPVFAARGRDQRDPMLDHLDRRDRLRLVEFVCSFAWADFEIQPEERVYIARLIRRLELDEDEDLQVQRWLDRPPGIDGLDPTAIPQEHRRLFVETIEGIIEADGEVSDEERDSFEVFQQLLNG